MLHRVTYYIVIYKITEPMLISLQKLQRKSQLKKEVSMIIHSNEHDLTLFDILMTEGLD